MASLICTGAAVSLFSLPQRASFNWPQLLASAFLYVGAAACVHVCIVWSVCRALREHIQRPTWLLGCEIWEGLYRLADLSSPFWQKERSFWVCAVVPLTVWSSVRFLKTRANGQDNEGASGELRHREIFYVEEGPSAWRALLPTVIIAIATQAGIAALLGQQIWIAGLLFAMSAGVLVWRSPSFHDTKALIFVLIDEECCALQRSFRSSSWPWREQR